MWLKCFVEVNVRERLRKHAITSNSVAAAIRHTDTKCSWKDQGMISPITQKNTDGYGMLWVCRDRGSSHWDHHSCMQSIIFLRKLPLQSGSCTCIYSAGFQTATWIYFSYEIQIWRSINLFWSWFDEDSSSTAPKVTMAVCNVLCYKHCVHSARYITNEQAW